VRKRPPTRFVLRAEICAAALFRDDIQFRAIRQNVRALASRKNPGKVAIPPQAATSRSVARCRGGFSRFSANVESQNLLRYRPSFLARAAQHKCTCRFRSRTP
jgi:hypothetical protein